MSRFNLSAFAVKERAITLFLLIAIAGAGLLAFTKLGRAEDPTFVVKIMTVTAIWPGATAEEMQNQVADRLEKRLQELEHYDRTETTSRPGLMTMKVYLKDNTPPAEVPAEFYQVRKKLGDEARLLPRGVLGPVFNDEYTDVYFSLYALKAADELAETDHRAFDRRIVVLDRGEFHDCPNRGRIAPGIDVGDVDRAGERVVGQFVDDSHRQRLFGADDRAVEREAPRPVRPDEAGHARHAAGAGEDSEPDFGKADRPAPARGDAQRAGEGDLEPAPHADAVDRCDDRLFRGIEHMADVREGRMGEALGRDRSARDRFARALDLRDVGMPDEDALRAAGQDQATGRLALEFASDRLRERGGALVGNQPRRRVGIADDRDRAVVLGGHGRALGHAV